MDLAPEIIFQNYQKKEFDKDTSINFLISLIENSNDEIIRLKSLRFIKKIKHFDNKLFKFIENLLISDSNIKIRCETAEIIKNYYLDKSFSLLTWTLKNESNIDCLAIIIKALIDFDTLESKKALFEEVEKIKKMKQLKVGQMVSSNHFRKQIKELVKKKKIGDLSIGILGEILINYKTILSIKKKFYSVYYELKNARIVKLELSDVEFEVRGWKAEFKNNIQKISEIPGLRYLKSLERLYLANNIIFNIEGLDDLPNLSYLDLSNNKVENIESLNVFKSIPRLKHVKLDGNSVVDKNIFEEFLKKVDIKFEIKTSLLD